jgi:hypothetical protein
MVEYFHIILETHEVIWAEGALAETVLGIDYEVFSNFAEYERLYPGEPRATMAPFAARPCGGGWADLTALLRLGASRVVDARDPFQKAYDRLAARGRDLIIQRQASVTAVPEVGVGGGSVRRRN